MRPIKWATPVKMNGVPNFWKIDELLYRSGRPTQEGLKNLKKFGISLIINLETFHNDVSKNIPDDKIYMKAWHPEDEDIIKIMKLIRKESSTNLNAKILIHCWQGSDRTGEISAVYRILEQNWSKDEAIKEMVKGGYGFHPLWENIIDYIENVDIDKLKQKLGYH